MAEFDIPLRLVRNKVRAEGGREIDKFRGIEPAVDTQNGAEAWIGSVTKANGSNEKNPFLGCSEIEMPDGSKEYLFKAIEQYPEELLGDRHIRRYGHNMGVLIKLLDAKAQFLLQCHPSRENASRFWNSSYGKEECWHIIGLRDDVPEKPHILLGFKEGISREKFEEYFHAGDTKALEALCHKIYVQPGESYIIPGGVPHALMSGCFVAEIQEPSDLTAVPIPQSELLAFRRRANPLGVFLPEDNELYESRMLNSFHYEGMSKEEVISRFRSKMHCLRLEGESTEFLVFGREDTTSFSCTVLQVKGEIKRKATGDVQIGIVLEGEGLVLSGGKRLPIAKGDELLFPAELPELTFSGNMRIILCNPGETADYE